MTMRALEPHDHQPYKEHNMSAVATIHEPEEVATQVPKPILQVRPVWYGDAQHTEQRREPREKLYKTHWLTMSSHGRDAQFLVVLLKDMSASGLGVLSQVAVEEGSEFTLAGDVEVSGEPIVISGRFRVAYCRLTEESMHRVGLASLDLPPRDIASVA